MFGFALFALLLNVIAVAINVWAFSITGNPLSLMFIVINVFCAAWMVFIMADNA